MTADYSFKKKLENINGKFQPCGVMLAPSMSLLRAMSYRLLLWMMEARQMGYRYKYHNHSCTWWVSCTLITSTTWLNRVTSTRVTCLIRRNVGKMWSIRFRIWWHRFKWGQLWRIRHWASCSHWHMECSLHHTLAHYTHLAGWRISSSVSGRAQCEYWGAKRKGLWIAFRSALKNAK